jgi:hypothetical protein
MKYKIINNCDECEHLVTERIYKPDPWDDCYKWICKKKNNKVIAMEVGVFNERDTQPKWCPLPDLPEPISK